MASLFGPGLRSLLDALRCLPGVGPKSAQRMALHLLERDRDGAGELSRSLTSALETVRQCERCRMFAEEQLCAICRSPSRDASQMCVVETPADVIAVEDSGGYRGRYFVLLGRLSPLDGIGPSELGIDQLEPMMSSGEIRELIIATSATVEGEATASFLAGIAGNHQISATRIAHGVPIGGELEYVDSGTLSRAISGRRALDQ
jgi:recombination protein RecR